MADLITIADDTLEGVQATRQRSFWDTITVAQSSNTVAAGTQYDVFTNVATKNSIQSNLTENSRLPLDWAGVIYRIRISMTTAAATNVDAENLVHGGLFEFFTDENDLRLQNPIADFPSGGGVYGDNGGATTATIMTVNNGMPTQTSAPALNTFGQVALTAGKIFRGRISFPTAITLTADSDLRVILDLKLYRPVR
jgi:hypothetical protein